MTSAYTQNPSEMYAQTFRGLNVDDKLAVLWHVYTAIAGSGGFQNANDNAAPDNSDGLFNKVKQKSQQEQLQIMRDLLQGKSSEITQEYQSLTNNTKLALWYQLAQGMERSEIIQAPSDYQLSAEAKKLLPSIQGVAFEQQYVFLRDSLLSDGGKPSV